MSTKPFNREYFTMAVSDHEMLTAFGERAKKMFIADSPPYVEKQISDIKLLLNEKLASHFAFEEAHIFPALLAANPGAETTRLVAALLDDHKSLTAAARQLNVMLTDQKLVSDRAGKLRQAIMDLFQNLQEHAAQEDGLFRALPGSTT